MSVRTRAYSNKASDISSSKAKALSHIRSNPDGKR